MKKFIWVVLLLLAFPLFVFAQGYDTGNSSGGAGTCTTSGCNLSASTTLNSKEICLADGTHCQAAGAINWADYSGEINDENINWADMTKSNMSPVGINWTDYRNISAAGINWTDWYNLAGVTINWTDYGSEPTSAVNWVDITGMDATGVLWSSFPNTQGYITGVTSDAPFTGSGTSASHLAINWSAVNGLIPAGGINTADTFNFTGTLQKGGKELCLADGTNCQAAGAINWLDYQAQQIYAQGINWIDYGSEPTTAINWVDITGMASTGVVWSAFPNTQGYITGVTADSPLSGSGTSGSHLVLSTAGTWSGTAAVASAVAASGVNWVDYSGISTNAPTAVNWIETSLIASSLSTPAGASNTQSLSVGSTGSQLEMTAAGKLHCLSGTTCGINWTDMDKITSAAVNWLDVQGIGENNINWSDLAGGKMQADGINWSDVSCPPGEHTARIVIDGPTAASDYEMGSWPCAFTIDGVYLLAEGSTAIGGFQECDSNGANCSAVAGDVTGTPGTLTSSLTLSNGGIDADDIVTWLTTSVSGTVTRMVAWFRYHYNSSL